MRSWGRTAPAKAPWQKVLWHGHPDYKVISGEVFMDGENILELEPDERARKGLFLAFQYPMEIPGVSIANFLRAAVQSRLGDGEELEATEYYARLYEKMDMLEMPRNFTSRSVNEGFSGGEKKRNEILQMAMLDPKYAILDETDSGLDIDALRVVAGGVNKAARPGSRHPFDHPLPAPARLHRARLRPRDGRGTHRDERGQGTRIAARGKRLRLGAKRGIEETGGGLILKIVNDEARMTNDE